MSKSSFAGLLAFVLLGLPIAASALTTDELQSRISWCPALQRPLWLGHRGSDVSDLQTFLHDEGVFDRAATGFFGPLTERALQEWQARHDIASTGDANTTGWGRLGPKTRERIAERCRPAGGASFSCPAVASTTPTESCTGAWERLNGLRGCHVGWRCVPMSYAQNHPPVISSFEGPTVLTVGESGTWIVQASDPENSTLSYRVMWGDEGIQERLLYLAELDTSVFSQSTTFTHAYARAGTYVVHLTARDSGGNTALGIMMVTVNQPLAHDVLLGQASREQLDQLPDSAAVRKLVCPLFERLEHPLFEGMNGDDVRGLQEFLRSEGFLSTVPTGFFGPRTHEALQRWQDAQHIVSNGNAQTTGWGIVGPATRERIRQWCAGTQELPTVPADTTNTGASCTTPWNTIVTHGQTAQGFCPDYPAGGLIGGGACGQTKLCQNGQWVPTTQTTNPANMPDNCKIWQTHGCSGYQRTQLGGPVTPYTGMCVQSSPLPTPQCNLYFDSTTDTGASCAANGTTYAEGLTIDACLLTSVATCNVGSVVMNKAKCANGTWLTCDWQGNNCQLPTTLPNTSSVNPNPSCTFSNTPVYSQCGGWYHCVVGGVVQTARYWTNSLQLCPLTQ